MPRSSELSTRRIQVAAGILIESDGRLLITDRSRAKSMNEYWEFPGGKLAECESAKDALVRELREELGIEINACEYFSRLEHDYPDTLVAIDFFLVRNWQGTPSGAEGQALRWLRASEISPELLLPADAPVLELLRKL